MIVMVMMIPLPVHVARGGLIDYAPMTNCRIVGVDLSESGSQLIR
jgi:hypothetical protein